MPGASEADARQVERAVLFVDCPPATGALCTALVRAVAPHAPGAIIRLDAGTDVDAIRITFHHDPSQGAFAGHLSWRTPDGAAGQGPMHRQTGGNVTTSSIAAQEFAEALVKKTPELQSTLASAK